MLKAAQFAMKMARDESIPAGEREQWFDTAKALFAECVQ